MSCPDAAEREGRGEWDGDESVPSEEEEAAAVWDCWVCGLVGLDSVSCPVSFCCVAVVGDGKSFHCPVYLGLFGFTASNGGAEMNGATIGAGDSW